MYTVTYIFSMMHHQLSIARTFFSHVIATGNYSHVSIVYLKGLRILMRGSRRPTLGI